MNLNREQCQELIIRCSGQLADLIVDGWGVKLCHSRSGIKLIRFKEKHEMLKKDNNIIIAQGEGLANGDD